MAFGFVGDWHRKIVDDPVDVKMTETLKIGLDVARERVHVITGYLKSTIGGEYNKSTKVIMLHADAPYAMIEEMRPPLGAHAYLAPAVNAMAGFWGGSYNFELHFPNAAVEHKSKEQLAAREKSWRKNLRFSAKRKTKVIARRWHKLMLDAPLDPADATTPLL